MGIYDATRLQQLSTNYEQKYARSNILPTVQVKEKRLTLTYLDYFDPIYNLLIDFITVTTPYTWGGYELIENVSYQFYNNTSLYWVISGYNGIIDDLEIVAGTVLQIPDLNQINDFLGLIKQRNVGTVVTL